VAGFFDIVVAMAYRIQLLRELQILAGFDGDAAIALVKQRSDMLVKEVDVPIGRYFLRAFTVTGTRKERSVSSTDSFRLLISHQNITAAEVLSFVSSRSVAAISSAEKAKTWKKVEASREKYHRY
jgi:hypothetical protein